MKAKIAWIVESKDFLSKEFFDFPHPKYYYEDGIYFVTKIGYREFKDYAQLIVQHNGVVEEEVITPRDIQFSSLPLRKAS